MTHMFLVFDVTNCPPAWHSLKPPGELRGARGPPLWEPLTLPAPRCQTFLYSSAAAGAAGLLPLTYRPGARSGNRANALHHDPSYRERRLATAKGRDDVLSRSRIMGCAELNNPGGGRGGETQKNKTTTSAARIVHGESWSCRLSAKASSPPSPSLSGGSDGYFSPPASSFSSSTHARVAPGRRAAVW